MNPQRKQNSFVELKFCASILQATRRIGNEMMENIDFEEKVDIDDLVLQSKPMEMAEIETDDIKQKPLESDHVGNKFKLKMEENILKLYEELDKEKSEHSTMDFNVRKLLKVRQFVEKIAEYGSLERSYESKPFSCKVCDASFFQVHEVREHIKIHDSISEVEDETTIFAIE